MVLASRQQNFLSFICAPSQTWTGNMKHNTITHFLCSSVIFWSSNNIRSQCQTLPPLFFFFSPSHTRLHTINPVNASVCGQLTTQLVLWHSVTPEAKGTLSLMWITTVAAHRDLSLSSQNGGNRSIYLFFQQALEKINSENLLKPLFSGIFTVVVSVLLMTAPGNNSSYEKYKGIKEVVCLLLGLKFLCWFLQMFFCWVAVNMFDLISL